MYRTTLFRRMSTSTVAITMATFGITGIASASTITNTGSNSTNKITSDITDNCQVHNTNNVSAHNTNHQTANTGSANVSGNTSAGMSWGGWSVYNPVASQTAGTSYASWRAGVTDWVAQHASGNGWNSSENNLAWTPGSSDWSSYDPMVWQGNGQSFGNWYNGLQSYLNANSPVWLMGWPADATGEGNFGGATSGNATNNNNANFTININNAARAVAGTDSCGHSNFTAPPATGGQGGGTFTPPAGGGGAVLGASTGGSGGSGAGKVLGASGGSGSGAFNPSSASFGGFHAPRNQGPNAPAGTAPVFRPAAAPSSTPVMPPAGGSGGGNGGSTGTNGTISTTGTNSRNIIASAVTDNSQVNNTNTVAVCNTSTQTASSGTANASGNTATWSAGSGDATNGNGTGVTGTLIN